MAGVASQVDGEVMSEYLVFDEVVLLKRTLFCWREVANKWGRDWMIPASPMLMEEHEIMTEENHGTVIQTMDEVELAGKYPEAVVCLFGDKNV